MVRCPIVLVGLALAGCGPGASQGRDGASLQLRRVAVTADVAACVAADVVEIDVLGRTRACTDDRVEVVLRDGQDAWSPSVHAVCGGRAEHADVLIVVDPGGVPLAAVRPLRWGLTALFDRIVGRGARVGVVLATAQGPRLLGPTEDPAAWAMHVGAIRARSTPLGAEAALDLAARTLGPLGAACGAPVGHALLLVGAASPPTFDLGWPLHVLTLTPDAVDDRWTQAVTQTGGRLYRASTPGDVPDALTGFGDELEATLHLSVAPSRCGIHALQVQTPDGATDTRLVRVPCDAQPIRRTP